MSTHVSFPTFVKTYAPASPARQAAIKVLRKAADDLPDLPTWKQVVGRLPPDDAKAHWKSLHSLHTLWRQNYSTGTRTEVIQPSTRLCEPEPMPTGSIRISARHNPVEFEVDGSLVMIPLGVIAWVKKVNDDECIVALLNGETLHVTNTPDEIRTQLQDPERHQLYRPKPNAECALDEIRESDARLLNN